MDEGLSLDELNANWHPDGTSKENSATSHEIPKIIDHVGHFQNSHNLDVMPSGDIETDENQRILVGGWPVNEHGYHDIAESNDPTLSKSIEDDITRRKASPDSEQPIYIKV